MGFMVHIYSYTDGSYNYLYFFPTFEKAHAFAVKEMVETYIKNGYKENGFDAYPNKNGELVLRYHLIKDAKTLGGVLNDFAEISIIHVEEGKEYVF